MRCAPTGQVIENRGHTTMIQPDLIPIMRAINTGDKARARRLLHNLLKSQPSAEAWYQASRMTESPQHERAALKRALDLDPYHTDSRRRLRQLETGEAPPQPVSQPPASDYFGLTQPDAESSGQPASAEDDLPPLKQARTRRERGTWFWVGIAGAILLSLSSTWFVLLVLGSGIPGQLRGLFTGQQPVTEIEGVPLAEAEDAVLHVEPSYGVELMRSEAVAEVLEPGFVHEHTFMARRGEEVAIGLQFLSPTATRVNRNVVVLDPDGRQVRCQRDRILQGDNGAVMTCRINKGGVWRVRLLGREGESTGVYVISVERLIG